MFQLELDCSQSTCDDVNRFDIFSARIETNSVNVTILEQCNSGGFSGFREIRAMSEEIKSKNPQQLLDVIMIYLITEEVTEEVDVT